MARLDIKRQQVLEPKRMSVAKNALKKRGIVFVENGKCLKFVHQGKEVKFYPYSGWHTGKTIKDGRGLCNLLKQLDNKQSQSMEQLNVRLQDTLENEVLSIVQKGIKSLEEIYKSYGFVLYKETREDFYARTDEGFKVHSWVKSGNVSVFVIDAGGRVHFDFTDMDTLKNRKRFEQIINQIKLKFNDPS